MGIQPWCQSNCIKDRLRSEEGQRDAYILLWGQAEFIKKDEVISEEKRKTHQQQINVMGEYKAESCNKPLINLIWAYAPYCPIFVQKFIQGQGKC